MRHSMHHSMHHTDYRSELDGIDPFALLGVPLAILLLGIIAIRMIMAAAVV